MSCERCQGTGSRVYPSTATWRGGIGGQAMTTDVCDSCWGSGDSENPGPDLRQADLKRGEPMKFEDVRNAQIEHAWRLAQDRVGQIKMDEVAYILAAAESVAKPIVVAVECEGCGGTKYEHRESMGCPDCDATGSVLVVAPCETCGGEQVLSDGACQHDVGICDADKRCPDCSDGTQRRWLLEALGGRKARPLDAVNVWAVDADGSFERFTDEDCWVVPEGKTDARL